MRDAIAAVRAAAASESRRDDIQATLTDLAKDPGAYESDPIFGDLARSVIAAPPAVRREPASYRTWGDDLDEKSHQQMRNACQLPVSVRGALMPDAHVGYGLPIGGVLATENAVIPYAVGVDIACRMRLTVLDLPLRTLDQDSKRLEKAIQRETRFGIGASFRKPHDHDVMDADWSMTEVTEKVRDRAWKQLGTSGSGNHFVEFGRLVIENESLGIEAGEYLALLSHSGSRGAGARVADHYSKLARRQHPELSKELSHLAWLDLDTEEGAEYWEAMQLMGRYAAANHELIHRFIHRNLGSNVLLDIENHHNFAWKEHHDGKEVIVHRKGATPAGEGVLGIIPGSMADPAYVVRGKGSADSLNSASHGAGRRMSRTKAKATYGWDDVKQMLKDRRVQLMSAGIDEVPMVYKNIDEVMAAQTDLVEPLARFEPRLVKMAPSGEPPED